MTSSVVGMFEASVMRRFKSLSKEVLNSYSHRGFSPVLHAAKRNQEPFQRFS